MKKPWEKLRRNVTAKGNTGDAVLFVEPELKTGSHNTQHGAEEPTGTREAGRWESRCALSLYMREVGAVGLLTREEEIELAIRIRAGDEEARAHMICANLRLVIKIAREYEGLGLPLLDLINERNLGLMKAVERFDPAKGSRLSTYGSWWIRQNIRRGLARQGKTIRLPIYLVDQISHLGRASAKLQVILGREPTDEVLAAELKLSLVRVAKLRMAAIRPLSLDAPLGDDQSSRLEDVVPDEYAALPGCELDDRGQVEMVLGLLKKLPPREASILRHRFGLGGRRERTLEEIGESLGVTRERIRQIQNAALGKLRKMLSQLETISLPA